MVATRHAGGSLLSLGNWAKTERGDKGEKMPCSAGFFAPSWGHVMGTLEGRWGSLPSSQDLPSARGRQAPADVLPPARQDAQPGAFLQPFSAFLPPPPPPRGRQLRSPSPAPWGQRRLHPVFSHQGWDSGRERTGAIPRPRCRAPHEPGDLPVTTGRGEPAPHPWALGTRGFKQSKGGF